MKSIKIDFTALIVGSLLFGMSFSSGNAQTDSSLDSPVVYRMFFEHVEDGMRFTGCVNTGGMCYSPEESVVQDCLDLDGTWTPCGWE